MKRIFKESIFFIIIVFIVFGLFPLVLFRMLAFPRASTELKQDVRRNLEEVLHKQEDILKLLWAERKSHARAISDSIQSSLFIHGDEDFVRLLNGENEYEYLRLKTQLECTKSDYGYKGIFICDGAGIIQATTEGQESLIGVNIIKEKPFRKIQETLYDGKIYVSDVIHFSNKDTDTPSMFISYPIKGRDLDVVGAVLLWMDASMLNAGMKDVGFGKTGEVYLINEDGVMVTQSRFSRDLAKKTGDSCKTCHQVEDPDTTMLTKGIKLCVSSKSSGFNLEGYRDYSGIKVVGAWTWLEDLNMGLMAEMDFDEAFDTLNNINTMVKSLMIVVVIPGVAMAFLIHRKMSKGFLIKDLPLPQKTLLGITSIIVVGFLIAIVDNYQSRKERGFIREQRYKVHNPLDTFGSIATWERDEDFIRKKIQKLKKDHQILKSENTIRNQEDKEKKTKEDQQQSAEKKLAIWNLEP